MRIRLRTILNLSLCMGAAATTLLLASQKLENQTLAESLSALPEAAPRGLPAPALPPGGGLNKRLRALAAKDGDTARHELAQRILNSGRSPEIAASMETGAPLLEGLSVQELKALIGTEPPIRFLVAADGRLGEPAADMAEASARAMALRRLCVLDPEQALKLCAAGATPKARDELLNVAEIGLRQWTPQDPAAALRWTISNSGWLPANNSLGYFVLTMAAKNGMREACGLARSVGLDLAQGMRQMSSAARSMADLEILMTEVSAAQAASPGGSVEGSVRGYQEITEQLGATLGFEGARQFAEKWAATLPGREDIALTAVKTTLARRPDPKAEAAADWMMHFVQEDRRAAAVENLVSAWADEDFSAPAAWLQKNSAAAWSDAGIAALCGKLAPFDPESAAEWAARIRDETLRAATQHNLAGKPGRAESAER